jgi:large subunit ribosomal protein L3
MLTSVFATKIGMTQAWTTSGKRLAVTRCKVNPMSVVSELTKADDQNQAMFEIGYGHKKLKNVPKPLRSKLEKGGFSYGVTQIKGMAIAPDANGETPSVGSTLKLESMLSVGDVVKVQGLTKGKGFAGAVKRHGFKGGPVTHGQSDRLRAVGSIGAGTTPGRVLKGKRMPGRMGTDKMTIQGLTVIHIDPVTQEVWLSGPVPGAIDGMMAIRRTGNTKEIALDLDASGIKVAEPVVEAVETTESTPETTEVVTETTESA